MLSESQERMLLVAEKGHEPEVLQVFKKWGLDAVVVGEVADGGLLRVKDHGVVVAEIPAHPLAEEGPVYQRPIAKPSRREESAADWFVFAPEKKNLANNFKQLLASPAISSKRWITEQYDTMVRTNTLAVPGAGDAAVVRIKGTKRALALATDGNGRWCQLNPRLGAMHAVAEAARNVACSGAKPIAATNCLNFGSPEKPEVMWQFSEVIDGLAAACNELGTPITGGNVSFYNETLGNSIYPTPVIGILGVIEDATNLLKMAFRDDRDIVVLLDGMSGASHSSAAMTSNRLDTQLAREFSSSEYSKTVGGIVAGEPPAIDLPAEKRLQQCMVALASSRTIQSAHDISDGGLAVTLAESCFASGPARKAGDTLGANIKIEDDTPAESAVFGERGARAVVSVSPVSLNNVMQTAQKYAVSAVQIGEVTANGIFRIELNGSAIIEEPVETLRDIWAHSLERALKQ
jgi:phosphoribosylformylglycinamidine synthase